LSPRARRAFSMAGDDTNTACTRSPGCTLRSGVEVWTCLSRLPSGWMCGRIPPPHVLTSRPTRGRRPTDAVHPATGFGMIPRRGPHLPPRRPPLACRGPRKAAQREQAARPASPHALPPTRHGCSTQMSSAEEPPHHAVERQHAIAL
jgi:hypothetical protein